MALKEALIALVVVVFLVALADSAGRQKVDWPELIAVLAVIIVAAMSIATAGSRRG